MDNLPDLNGLPDRVKQNAILALANGVMGLINAAAEIPTAYLEGISDVIRSKTDGKVKIIRASAQIAIDQIRSDPEITQRALNYFDSKLLREQQNRESVANKFLSNLKKIETFAAAGELEDDWLVSFWKLAETKTSEDIQEVLSNLLASEVARPGSISPSTLQTLSVLTPDLAKRFAKLCRLSIVDDEGTSVIHPNVFPFQNIGPLDEFDISYGDLFALEDARLIRSAETITFNYSTTEGHALEPIDFGGAPAMLDKAGQQLREIPFTTAGEELRRLIPLTPLPAYAVKLKELLKEAFSFSDGS